MSVLKSFPPIFPPIFRWRTALCLVVTVLTVEACAGHKAQHTNWTVRQQGDAAQKVAKADEWVCEAFRPIRFSDQDTPATMAQIAEHNEVWEVLCPEGIE